MVETSEFVVIQVAYGIMHLSLFQHETTEISNINDIVFLNKNILSFLQLDSFCSMWI